MNSYKNRVSQVEEEGDEVANYEPDNYREQTKRVKKTHIVRRGESLGKIASKYDMTLAQVKKMNKLRSSTVRSGQRLTVYNWVKTKVPVKAVSNDELTVKKEVAHKADTVQKTEVDEQADAINDTQKVSNETAEVKNSPKPAFTYYIVLFDVVMYETVT